MWDVGLIPIVHSRRLCLMWALRRGPSPLRILEREQMTEPKERKRALRKKAAGAPPYCSSLLLMQSDEKLEIS